MWWLKWHWVNFFFGTNTFKANIFFFCFVSYTYFNGIFKFWSNSFSLGMHYWFWIQWNIYLRHIFFLFVNISSGIVVLCFLWYNKSLTVTCKYRTLILLSNCFMGFFCCCLQFTFKLNSIRKKCHLITIVSLGFILLFFFFLHSSVHFIRNKYFKYLKKKIEYKSIEI